MQRYFKGKGDGGADDWTKWGAYHFGKRPWDEDSDPPGVNDTCIDVDEVDHVVVYVRAFSDGDFQNWNQDSRDITDDYFGEDGYTGDDDTGDDDTGDDDTDDDGEDTPGFGILIISIAVIVSIVIVRRRR